MTIERVDIIEAHVAPCSAPAPHHGGALSVGVVTMRRGDAFPSVLVIDETGSAHAARISPRRMQRLMTALERAAELAFGEGWRERHAGAWGPPKTVRTEPAAAPAPTRDEPVTHRAGVPMGRKRVAP